LPTLNSTSASSQRVAGHGTYHEPSVRCNRILAKKMLLDQSLYRYAAVESAKSIAVRCSHVALEALLLVNATESFSGICVGAEYFPKSTQ
jgi:hypothetical protein